MHGTEIWSCGEYSTVDSKWHILVQPEGCSIADIALDEPLRKVNDVADSIEYPCETEGKALVTRDLSSQNLSNLSWYYLSTASASYRLRTREIPSGISIPSLALSAITLCPLYNSIPSSSTYYRVKGIAVSSNGTLIVYDPDYSTNDKLTEFLEHIDGIEFIYELATPVTELVDAPQIQEANSYTCVITPGAKAISWSSFTTS